MAGGIPNTVTKLFGTIGYYEPAEIDNAYAGNRWPHRAGQSCDRFLS